MGNRIPQKIGEDMEISICSGSEGIQISPKIITITKEEMSAGRR